MKTSRSSIRKPLVLVAIAAAIAAVVRSRRSDRPGPDDDSRLEEAGKESFPASDPPSHW